jgi:S1-C subfamily serine protease
MKGHLNMKSRLFLALLVILYTSSLGLSADLDPKLKQFESSRMDVIKKVAPAVVAVVTGGGSGVLISEDGFALTNFHVVAGQSPALKCGLQDGILYDAVLVGLDKVGDVALIKLLPKEPSKPFPFVKLANSDKVQVGDFSIAMGNPFMLATDFSPTVTFGLVSGTHRYQYPEKGMFEYPGNSGGPLFNMNAELIGINGRGSFDKRSRINSGVGYAISINQIKNFMGHLRAGHFIDHASLGAVVSSGLEESALGKVTVSGMIDSDASRRGIKIDDQILFFAGRPMTSVNQFKNVLGLYPKGWRLPLTYKRELENGSSERKEILVRLMGSEKTEIGNPNGAPPVPADPKPMPMPLPKGQVPPKAPGPKAPTGPAAKLYEAKPGYANYHFNKIEKEKLLSNFKKNGDFSSFSGNWQVQTTGKIGDKGRQAVVVLRIIAKGAKDAKNDLVQGIFDGIDFSVEPLAVEQSGKALKDPPGSGGLLVAFFQLRQLLAYGEKGFVGDFSHGGIEPYYTPTENTLKPNYATQRIDAEVLRTNLAGVNTKWYFNPSDYKLLGYEVSTDREDDPCEIHLSDYKKDSSGREVPGKILVKYGDKEYASLKVDGWKLE